MPQLKIINASQSSIHKFAWWSPSRPKHVVLITTLLTDDKLAVFLTSLHYTFMTLQNPQTQNLCWLSIKCAPKLLKWIFVVVAYNKLSVQKMVIYCVLHLYLLQNSFLNYTVNLQRMFLVSRKTKTLHFNNHFERWVVVSKFILSSEFCIYFSVPTRSDVSHNSFGTLGYIWDILHYVNT